MPRPPRTSDEGRRILRRIRSIKPFVRGSLTITHKRCGNPNCRCANDGPLHETALLTWKEGNRTRTLYVPVGLREQVAKWVEEGRLLRQLIAEMSEAQRNFLISMREKAKR